MATFEKDEMEIGPALRASNLADGDVKDLRPLNQPTTREERLGTAISMIVLAAGLVLLVVWAETRPSVRLCSAIDDVNARTACFEELRAQFLQPPAKGGGGLPRIEN
jgi:hypothetical protein